MEFREESCAFEDQSRREVDTEGLDHHVDVPKYVPDRVGIERVARHLIEVCILDWYGCGRTRQSTNAVAGAKRGPHRFKSDAVAGTYDENLGHVLSQLIFVFGPVLTSRSVRSAN